MDKNQKQVKEFSEAFDFPVRETPTQLSEEEAKTRASLILEEAFELITKGLGLAVRIRTDEYSGCLVTEKSLNSLNLEYKKSKEMDLVETADAIGDLQYVNLGLAVQSGIDLEPIANEIHSSNMTKLWKRSEVESEAFKEGWTKKEVMNNYFIVKNENGKAVKSPSYIPANLEKILFPQKDLEIEEKQSVFSFDEKDKSENSETME